MPAIPQIDPVQLEQTLAGAIRDVFLSVPLIAQFVKVEAQERFPETDEEDEALTTIVDPANVDLRFTSIIQIGFPTVAESPYTSEQQTKLEFTYPITFDMGVKDRWDNPIDSLPYPSSRALSMAVYMLARNKFKQNRELGGFENCVHDYLQQDSASTVEDEETGGQLHVFDWSLVVHVSGVLV